MVNFLEDDSNDDTLTKNKTIKSPWKLQIFQSFWSAKVVIGIALLALTVKGYYSDWGQKKINISPGLVTTSEVINNAENLIGRSVTIRSKPLETVSSNSFTLSDRQVFGDAQIMVVNASEQPFDLPTDSEIPIQVTGEVRSLVIPEIEQEFNIFLEDQSYADYMNQPVIIARSMMVAPRPGQITTNPSKFYGQRLAVTGQVANIQSPVLFSLDENQWFGRAKLLVLLNKPPVVAINENQIVTVIGVVRPFIVADIERDYKVTWDLEVKRQLEGQYNNKPIFIAEVIYPTTN